MYMDINLEYYKIFYYVAKNKNISKAAEELNVSQPAISKTIKILEEQLNTHLFIRNKRGVILTREGTILFNKISSSLEGLIETNITLSNLFDFDNFKICVGSQILDNLIIPEINNLNLNTNITFIENNYNFNYLEEKILSKNIDLAIVTNSNNYKFDDKINIKSLFPLHCCFIVSPEYYNKNNMQDTHFLKDLKNNTFIIQNAQKKERILFEKYKNIFKFNLEHIIEVNNYNSMIDLVKSGCGISLAIEEFHINDFKNNKLMKLDLKETLDLFDLTCIYRKEDMNNLNLNNFLKIFNKK